MAYYNVSTENNLKQSNNVVKMKIVATLTL